MRNKFTLDYIGLGKIGVNGQRFFHVWPCQVAYFLGPFFVIAREPAEVEVGFGHCHMGGGEIGFQFQGSFQLAQCLPDRGGGADVESFGQFNLTDSVTGFQLGFLNRFQQLLVGIVRLD